MTFDVLDGPSAGAETILLAAGLGGAAGYWTPQLAALRQRYRVVTYDQAGTGRNRCELPHEHSIAAMADEALAVLEASGSANAHFVGHALGGLVGLELALRRPDRLASLTVVNGWAAASAHTRRCFEMRLALLAHEGPAAYVRAQPIFLYPADWLARNSARMAEEEAHGLAGFQGADTLRKRIRAVGRACHQRHRAGRLQFAAARFPGAQGQAVARTEKEPAFPPRTTGSKLARELPAPRGETAPDLAIAGPYRPA